MAGGGGGTLGVQAPRSGAARTKKVAQSPHPMEQPLAQKLLREHLSQWLWEVGRGSFFKGILAEAHVRQTEEPDCLDPLAGLYSHPLIKANLLLPKQKDQNHQGPGRSPMTPICPPPPSLTGGGLRRRLRSWGLAPGF